VKPLHRPLGKDEKWRIWWLRSEVTLRVICWRIKKELNSTRVTRQLDEDEAEKTAPKCTPIAIMSTFKLTLPSFSLSLFPTLIFKNLFIIFIFTFDRPSPFDRANFIPNLYYNLFLLIYVYTYVSSSSLLATLLPIKD
jgi:hypothetical protein